MGGRGVLGGRSFRAWTLLSRSAKQNYRLQPDSKGCPCLTPPPRPSLALSHTSLAHPALPHAQAICLIRALSLSSDLPAVPHSAHGHPTGQSFTGALMELQQHPHSCMSPTVFSVARVIMGLTLFACLHILKIWLSLRMQLGGGRRHDQGAFSSASQVHEKGVEEHTCHPPCTDDTCQQKQSSRLGSP